MVMNFNITYCPSDDMDMLADIFTKPLNNVKVEKFRKEMLHG